MGQPRNFVHMVNFGGVQTRECDREVANISGPQAVLQTSAHQQEKRMSHDHDETNSALGHTRRHALECMIWAGTGVLWTLAGGVPRSLGLLSNAEAAAAGFTFLQISDSHVGFDKAANPHAIDTLKEAIAKVKAIPHRPDFLNPTVDNS